MFKCSNCNAEFEGNFCPKCGTPANTTTETSTENKPKIDLTKKSTIENSANPTVSVNTVNTADNKKSNFYPLLIIPFLLILVFLMPSDNYKSPIKRLEKGINKADSKKLISAICTDDMLKDSKKSSKKLFGSMSKSDFYDQIDEGMEEFYDSLEDKYGDDVKIKFDIDDKKKVKPKKLDDYEKDYKDSLDIKVKIKKAYKLDCSLEIKGDKDSDEIDDIELIVIKVSGEGWLILPDSITESTFDFLW